MDSGAPTTWGALHILHALVANEEQVADGEKDRKQTDLTLLRFLGSEELVKALQHSSLVDLDAALAHDGLAVERKPYSHLHLLTHKAAKLAQWAGRRLSPDDQALYRAHSARLVTQIGQFMSQVPVSVAAKEIRRVSQLCKQYVAMLTELAQSLRGVFPLKSFLRRFHQHGHMTITPIHGQFLYLCRHAKCYSAALEVLSQPLLEIQAQASFTSADFMSYAYNGGMIYLGQKQYQDAIDFFTLAVTAPAVMLSAFAVEAYKKRLLASLILHGEVSPLPKYAPFVVSRHIEVHCGAYEELRRAFTVDKTLTKLQKVVEAHAQGFVKDGNFGLVKQVLEAQKQRRLLQLPRTYVTIALAEVTKAAALDSDVAAEKLLLTLIARGDLAAVVDKQRKMVKFVLDEDDEDQSHTVTTSAAAEQAAAMEQLQREMNKLLVVSAQLRNVDTEIVTSAKFQSRMQKDKERRLRGSQAHDDLQRQAALEAMEGY